MITFCQWLQYVANTKATSNTHNQRQLLHKCKSTEFVFKQEIWQFPISMMILQESHAQRCSFSLSISLLLSLSLSLSPYFSLTRSLYRSLVRSLSFGILTRHKHWHITHTHTHIGLTHQDDARWFVVKAEIVLRFQFLGYSISINSESVNAKNPDDLCQKHTSTDRILITLDDKRLNVLFLLTSVFFLLVACKRQRKRKKRKEKEPTT